MNPHPHPPTSSQRSIPKSPTQNPDYDMNMMSGTAVDMGINMDMNKNRKRDVMPKAEMMPLEMLMKGVTERDVLGKQSVEEGNVMGQGLERDEMSGERMGDAMREEPKQDEMVMRAGEGTAMDGMKRAVMLLDMDMDTDKGMESEMGMEMGM
jgi:hypothetical protein